VRAVETVQTVRTDHQGDAEKSDENARPLESTNWRSLATEPPRNAADRLFRWPVGFAPAFASTALGVPHRWSSQTSHSQVTVRTGVDATTALEVRCGLWVKLA
jgi:hypothetical protein